MPKDTDLYVWIHPYMCTHTHIAQYTDTVDKVLLFFMSAFYCIPVLEAFHRTMTIIT